MPRQPISPVSAAISFALSESVCKPLVLPARFAGNLGETNRSD